MPRKFRLLLNPRPACRANAASSGQQLNKTNLKYSNATCIRSQAKVHPQFTRNYTPQNGIISSFSALSSISVLPVRLLGLPWKWRNSLRLRSPESKGIKFVPGKARRNDMYRAYMESKQRSRTHILCLLTVFLVNWEYNLFIYNTGSRFLFWPVMRSRPPYIWGRAESGLRSGFSLLKQKYCSILSIIRSFYLRLVK